jgi:hypothetical protein
MKKSELSKLIREEIKKVLKEVDEPSIYRYDFMLSRGLFYDGQSEVTKQQMMNFVEEMWEEQGPDGYDIMQIYATKNTETKDPVIILELDDSVVLFSAVQLNEQVAMKTAKAGSQGTVIQPQNIANILK